MDFRTEMLKACAPDSNLSGVCAPTDNDDKGHRKHRYAARTKTPDWRNWFPVEFNIAENDQSARMFRQIISDL